MNILRRQHIPLIPLAAVVVLLHLTLSGCKKDKDSGDEQCSSVAPTGSLGTNGETFTFTGQGGAKIEINPFTGIKITHADYPAFQLDCWGGLTVNGEDVISANHENLNGKHIKDRKEDRRTFIFPDGAKITFLTEGYQQRMLWISIYDGKQYHRINMVCKTVETSAANANDVAQTDAKEADGETAAIEFTATGLLFVNIYQEDVPGNKVQHREPLGEIYRDQPSRVNDYYDDPRRSDT